MYQNVCRDCGKIYKSEDGKIFTDSNGYFVKTIHAKELIIVKCDCCKNKIIFTK